ncbi:MAG: hypothetical protein LUC33_01385 [Prevotellaceae bacterium]|nr:hypothetical protein [Prevotellaceae bacterium]
MPKEIQKNLDETASFQESCMCGPHDILRMMLLLWSPLLALMLLLFWLNGHPSKLFSAETSGSHLEMLLHEPRPAEQISP